VLQDHETVQDLCKYYVISIVCSCSYFTIVNVKVAFLTQFEELLIHNRAMCLFGAQIYDVFAKNGRYHSVALSKRGANISFVVTKTVRDYGLKSVVFSQNDLNYLTFRESRHRSPRKNLFDMCQLAGVI